MMGAGPKRYTGVPVTGHRIVVSTASRLRHEATAPPAHKIKVFTKYAALLDDSRSIRHGDEIQKVAEESPLAIGWSISESSAQLGPSWSDSSLPIT
jgi:hypothetical protein